MSLFSRNTSSVRLSNKVKQQGSDFDSSEIHESESLKMVESLHNLDFMITENTSNSDGSPLLIDVLKQEDDIEQNDDQLNLESQLQSIHDLIINQFNDLCIKHEIQFDELKKMINPTYDTPRRRLSPSSPISTIINEKVPNLEVVEEEVTKNSAKIQEEVPIITLKKKNYFKRLVSNMNRRIKKFF